MSAIVGIDRLGSGTRPADNGFYRSGEVICWTVHRARADRGRAARHGLPDREPAIRRRGGVAGDLAELLTDDASRGRFLRECIRARTVQHPLRGPALRGVHRRFQRAGGVRAGGQAPGRADAGVACRAPAAGGRAAARARGAADRLADRRRPVGDPPGRPGARQPALDQHLLRGRRDPHLRSRRRVGAAGGDRRARRAARGQGERPISRGGGRAAVVTRPATSTRSRTSPVRCSGS